MLDINLTKKFHSELIQLFITTEKHNFYLAQKRPSKLRAFAHLTSNTIYFYFLDDKHTQ